MDPETNDRWTIRITYQPTNDPTGDQDGPIVIERSGIEGEASTGTLRHLSVVMGEMLQALRMQGVGAGQVIEPDLVAEDIADGLRNN